MTSIFTAIVFIGIVGIGLELLENTSAIAKKKAEKDTGSFFSDLDEESDDESENETIVFEDL